LVELAAIIEEAVKLFGSSYPRERKERQDLLKQIPKDVLDALDRRFYALLDKEEGGFEATAEK
jgi:hypothetical protein